MEIAILLITLIILAETSVLMSNKLKPGMASGRRKIYIDTSVLIDGRIIKIAESGFLDGDLIILKSVLLELQLLADNKDNDRRNLGRAGLNAVSELERVVNVNTEIVDDTGGLKKVDEELLKVAKENKGAIMSIDYNLLQVAKAEKIETLNINDLSLAIRNEFKHGERFRIKITEKGTGRGQSVGRLPNGIMVVVENASNKIGQEVTVEFLRFFENSAGRIIFAKLVKDGKK